MINSKKLRAAVAAFGCVALAACTTTGTDSVNTASVKPTQTSTYKPGTSQLDRTRHNYVECLLQTRNDNQCSSQRNAFANAVESAAFNHGSTFQSHRQARSNKDFIALTVSKAVADTRRLALR